MIYCFYAFASPYSLNSLFYSSFL